MLYHIDIGERDYLDRCTISANEDISTVKELCKEFGCYRQDSHIICSDDSVLFYTSLDVFNVVETKRRLIRGL